MYCEKCSRLFEGGHGACPSCGSKKIRYPRVDDPCFLTEKESVWGDMLADVLSQNGIPFEKRPVLGAGLALRLGQGMERYRFYVLHGRLEEAWALTQALFPEEN